MGAGQSRAKALGGAFYELTEEALALVLAMPGEGARAARPARVHGTRLP